MGGAPIASPIHLLRTKWDSRNCDLSPESRTSSWLRGFNGVYYVRVRDDKGNEHSRWIRCGVWIMGLATEKTEVRWESETS
jgi:hypothetical protein